MPRYFVVRQYYTSNEAIGSILSFEACCGKGALTIYHTLRFKSSVLAASAELDNNRSPKQRAIPGNRNLPVYLQLRPTVGENVGTPLSTQPRMVQKP